MKKMMMMTVALLMMAAGPSLATEDNKNAACKSAQSVAIVDGMVCDFCTQSITKVLKKNESVKDVTIDLNTKKVTVDIKDGKEFSDKDMEKAIDYAGYKLVKIDRVCKG